MSLDKKYLRDAYEVASNSMDPSTQNGAILVTLSGEQVEACNAIHHTLSATPERLLRPDKLIYMEHAERNVIYAAASRSYSTYGSTVYCPWAPCTDCARALIGSGVKRLVIHKTMLDRTPERWLASVLLGIEMIKESGLTVDMIAGKLNATTILFDGKLFYP